MNASPQATASLRVPVVQLPHGLGLPLPAFQTAGAAGLDLQAAIASDEHITLGKSERALVPTGLALQLPEGYEAQVRPRSGLAVKFGVTVLNAPGTVDADYRGEIKVLLINHGSGPFVITRGMRIAQLIVAPVTLAELTIVAELAPSGRGDGGFGSTGA
ncbi:MAG: dUTP diphosphatase [Methylocystis sp.]|nr:dUTP diphosphatase [Methylocystis sp.]MCA3582889.1 dUTP diphosphatase [Methylocystis sp.]MCA3589186.1 dUTP diphosphatase [Methylocystis sp.]MCA3590647.1 dUTP diphosphatase [Methylocystis sp.]